MKSLAKLILEIEAKAILEVANNIDDSFIKAINSIMLCTGHIVVTGVGKSSIVGRKISATLSSTGTPSFFINAMDSLHGDLGAITKHDIILAISNSGETTELLQMIACLPRNIVISMTGNNNSTLAKQSSIIIDLHSNMKEACPLNLAPTSSTTSCLAMGDALAICLMVELKFSTADFKRLHPSGTLGKV